MTDPDAVFTKFVEANPVPDVSKLGEPRPNVTAFGSGAASRREDLRPATPAPSRAAWAAAAAFLLVLAVGGLLLAWPDQPASHPTEQPTAEEVLRRDAVATVEEWLAALNADDIDRVMALSSVAARSEADRRVHEWQAGLAGAGMPVQVQDCAVASATASTARVECAVRLGDLVAIELGVAELTAPFDYDGLVTWRPYTGGNISEVNDAYATYLRTFHTADYEARCSPAAYAPGTIVQDRGLALTGECAELAAALSTDVAQWVADGRPEDQP